MTLQKRIDDTLDLIGRGCFVRAAAEVGAIAALELPPSGDANAMEIADLAHCVVLELEKQNAATARAALESMRAAYLTPQARLRLIAGGGG